MACDLCGADGPTSLARIEGVVYKACSSCAAFGEKVEEYRPKQKRGPRVEDRVVRPDAGQLIRKAREKSGQTQKRFAQRLGVKESELHAWESGHRQPTLDTARRIERALDISLLQRDEPVQGSFSSGPDQGMTIGDVFKKR